MSASETVEWDLEDKPMRAPCHAKPIDQMFGKYRVKTWDVEEEVWMVGGGSYSFSTYIEALKSAQKSLTGLHIGDRTYPTRVCHGASVDYRMPEDIPLYLLRGNLSVSKVCEWKGVIPVEQGYASHQLFRPRTLANLVVEELTNQGIQINPVKTKNLLDEALKPYVNRALLVCVDRKWLRPWEKIEVNESDKDM